MGVFEFDKFAAGTNAIATTLADLSAKGCCTIIGGGDSVAAVEKAGLAEKMPTSPPAVAPASSCWKARCCPVWPPSTPPDHRPQGGVTPPKSSTDSAALSGAAFYWAVVC